MHFLLTNDDGVRHPGLAALAAALRGHGRVTVIAPDRNRSASGHVKTLHKPLRVEAAQLADGSAALASNGAPSDCVALALLGLVEEPVDVVVAGINPNANLGHDVTYSGTVTAAMEAVIAGVPGLAVSRRRDEADSFAVAAEVGAALALRIAQAGLPPYTLLNVNVPGGTWAAVRGVKVTHQGLRTYRDELDRRVDPWGRPYYWIGGEAPTGVPGDGSDIQALEEGFVSVTPIQLDFTAHGFLDELRAWGLEEGLPHGLGAPGGRAAPSA